MQSDPHIAGTTPRLPIYLLLDCSGTMLGAKFSGVTRGVAAICDTLGRDPRSRDTAHICVIWFNDRAYKEPLVPIRQFMVPAMKILGKTALGDALRMLNESLDADLRPSRDDVLRGAITGPADFQPIVFLLTDGDPSDDWRQQAQALRERRFHEARVVALAIGNDAKVELLCEITDTVLKLEGDWEQGLQAYFNWIGESVTQTHLRLVLGEMGPPFSALPDGISDVSGRDADQSEEGR